MSARHHVFRGERLQAFSDAVFAIVATIMVIPLKIEEEELHEEFVLRQYLLDLYPRYLVYLFSFTLVVDTWYSHARIFSIVEQVDDVILWLNLLSLLFISFLPYGISLISQFQYILPEGFGVAVSICSNIIILTGITMGIMVLYAFRKQSLLHPEVADNLEIRSLKIGLLITLSVNPVLAIVAQIFQSFKSTEYVSLVFFYSMGISSYAVRIMVHLYHRRKRYSLPDFAVSMFRNIANKTRTEAFSDGLFSIVATLIVLDFTTKVPSDDDVKNLHGGDLKRALGFRRYIYLSYVASFCIVGLLWVVQYGMFHFLKKITPLLSFVNTLTLCMVGGIPFISSIFVTFTNRLDSDDQYYSVDNEIVAIQASVVLLFLVGVSQLTFWTIALNSKTKCLHEEIDRYPAEILMFVKIMIFPTVSGLLFGLSFSEHVSVEHVYGSLIVATPFLFLLAKGLFSFHERFRSPMEKMKRLLIKDNNQQGASAMGYDSASTTSSTKPLISSPINSATTYIGEQVPLRAADS